MISRSDFESLPESASSLDYNPRSRVQGSVFSGGGDPYLRISKDTESEILRAEEEAEGPDADLKKKIDEWRAHAQDFKTGAGFRKASRGSVDPRRFALHLSRIALRHAKQYGSKSLLKISKRLQWAASQSRQAAEQELQKISNETDDPEEYQVGRSRIEKPVVAPPAPQWGVQGPEPGVDPKELPVQPGSMRQKLPDQSWSSEKTGSRRRANDEPNSDLVEKARKVLEDYRSQNSLGDDKELLESLDTDEVFQSFVEELNRQGTIADPEDLDEAWNKALAEMTDESLGSEGELTPDITTSKKSPTRDPHIPGPTAPAPGGDPFNSVLDSTTYPGDDRYVRQKERRVERKMHSHKNGYNWENSFIEDDHQSGMDHFLRRASSESEEEEEVIRIANQFLDGAAGALTPDQIAPEDVEEFVKENYPDAEHKKVYAVIAEITDPKKRHEKDKKKRTNDDYKASRPVQTTRKRPRVVSSHYVSAFDTIDSTPNRHYAHLQGHREICACCMGTGQEGAGACPRCQGKGRHGLDPDDSQIAAKARVIKKVGSLLLVEINPNQLVPKGRQALSQVTRTRVASGNRVRYTHSPELMRFLGEL